MRPISANVPILMLTARTETQDRVKGFENGVDDYLGKPYEPRELALRVASILRRAQPRAAPGPVTQVRFSDFCFDLNRGELRQRDEVVRLTDREREMLRLLAEHAGETVPREALAGSASRATNAQSMSRSTACAARSSAILQTRCTCRRRAAPAIACLSTAEDAGGPWGWSVDPRA